MTIGILKEPSYETRVSLLPEAVITLIKKRITVFVENGAGGRAFADDNNYQKAGAEIKNRNEILELSDIILSIHQPGSEFPIANSLPAGQAGKILIGIYSPLYNQQLVQQWARQGITSFSLDMLPRTTRAQMMDVLSSQEILQDIKRCWKLLIYTQDTFRCL